MARKEQLVVKRKIKRLKKLINFIATVGYIDGDIKQKINKDLIQEIIYLENTLVPIRKLEVCDE